MRSSSGHISASVSADKHLRVKDFLRNEHVVLDSPEDDLGMDDTLLKGSFLHQELRSGLTLHVSDVTEERAFTATSLIHEGLSCIFFLDGQIDLSIGDRKFGFRSDKKSAITGAAIMCTSDESFRRASQGHQHLCHLVVSATPEWLHLDAMEDLSNQQSAKRLFKDNLTDHRWVLTPRMIELIKQILAPSSLRPELRNLYLEGRAVEIVTETISAVMQAGQNIAKSTIPSRYDTLRLQRAKDLIESHLTEPLSVERIAREAGMSASGLQRLFRITEGHSVFEYVRGLRLERAFSMLKSGEAGIQEACIIAGYTNPANFATAFRRQFGITPRDACNRPYFNKQNH